jgi:hypothetical protein
MTATLLIFLKDTTKYILIERDVWLDCGIEFYEIKLVDINLTILKSSALLQKDYEALVNFLKLHHRIYRINN